MAKEFARKFYNSTRWRKCAKVFAQSKLYICEMCHNKTVARKGTDGQRFIVHHKVSLTPQNINNFDIAYGWDNLMLLCLECHNKIHSRDNNTRTMHFDEDGNLVAVDEPVRVDE